MLGQNFFLWQIQVIVSHLIDEVFCRACLVNNFFKIPRSYFFIRISSKPSKITIATSQWANVVRNTESQDFFYLFFIFLQEWIMFSLPTENGIHFLKMNLMRNRTVIKGALFSQENFTFDFIKEIICSFKFRKKIFDVFVKCFLSGFAIYIPSIPIFRLVRENFIIFFLNIVLDELF